MAAPGSALARGCGGGGHNAQPQGDGDHHGRPGRRNRGERGGPGHHGGPDGAHDGPRGPRHGHPGRRGRRGHGGPDVDVTIGGYGYPGGRIGPATPACAELAKLRHDLNRLFQLRQQVNSGKRFIMDYGNGQHRVVTARDYNAMVDAYAAAARGTMTPEERQRADDAGLDDIAAAQASYLRNRANARDDSLAIIDGRINATQERANQLEYECSE
jgi:hypothetical protein